MKRSFLRNPPDARGEVRNAPCEAKTVENLRKHGSYTHLRQLIYRMSFEPSAFVA